MSKLYLYNYNNYFNKIVKKETSLANYGTPIYSIANVNFNYNDGVNTSHVINYNGQDGDYVIITDDSNNISSRWFVMENVRNRGGQHNLTLRRDLIVDFYNSVINAPMIINRAMLTKNNPLIYNPEGFSFNQIKKEEILLKDRLGIPWIILYMAKNAESAEITIPSNSYTPDITLNTSIENSIYAAGTKYTKATDTTYSIYYVDQKGSSADPSIDQGYCIKFDKNLAYFRRIAPYDYSGNLILGNCDANYFIQQVGSTLVNNYSNYDTLLNTYLAKPTITDANLALIKKASDQGLIIKDTNNKYYRIQVIINDSGEEGALPSNEPLFTALNNVVTNAFRVVRGASEGTYIFGTNYDEVTTILTDVSSQYGNTITLDPSTKFETMDSECNIIAIPYADTIVHNSYYMEDDTPIFTDLNITKENQLNIAIQFAQEYTNSVVYDMQLIPYCPVQKFIEQDNHLDVSGYSGQTGYYTKWNLDTGYLGVVFHLTTKQLSFDINQRLSIPTVTGDINLDTKISNECDIVRLCSPNFNGIFEFSVAKNNGVDSFNVDITLRPYNPYIHINPNFKNIYGYDFNDARGLICGGDFSLPIIGDQFEQYELQNKNYQIAFNRQIEHMDFEYSIQKKEALFGAIAGTISGAAKGGFTGGITGGPYGAAAGAIVGGALSGIGGVLDYSNLIARQRENRQFAIDNFRYQLGNIQALPYNLNKVNPFTLNNKIFPFIEIYSCTDEEKTILINKITYTSMNVNAIGKISDYLQSSRTFIQGDLIRLELDISEHELIEIYNELKRGVYI